MCGTPSKLCDASASLKSECKINTNILMLHDMQTKICANDYTWYSRAGRTWLRWTCFLWLYTWNDAYSFLLWLEIQNQSMKLMNATRKTVKVIESMICCNLILNICDFITMSIYITIADHCVESPGGRPGRQLAARPPGGKADLEQGEGISKPNSWKSWSRKDALRRGVLHTECNYRHADGQEI